MKNYLYFFSVLFFLSFHLSYSQNTNVTIDAGAYYFNPDPIEIEVGSTVTWMNVGGLHDVNGVTNTITGTYTAKFNPERDVVYVNVSSNIYLDKAPGSIDLHLLDCYIDASMTKIFHTLKGNIGVGKKIAYN